MGDGAPFESGGDGGYKWYDAIGERSFWMMFVLQLLLYVSMDGVGDGGNINDGICSEGNDVCCGTRQPLSALSRCVW